MLVVDDQPVVREVVGRYLERDGIRVHEATTGPDRHALATALPHPVTSNLDLHGNVP